MKQLLNTLFVTSEDVYLSLDGENVVANRDGTAVARYPLHTLQSIVTFSYSGASPALMGPAPVGKLGWPSAPPEDGSWPGSPARHRGIFCFEGCSTGRRMTRLRAAASPGT